MRDPAVQKPSPTIAAITAGSTSWNNAGVAQHRETHDRMEFSQDHRHQPRPSYPPSRAEPMRKQRAGVILNIGSISGYISTLRRSGLQRLQGGCMLAKSIASDYAGENIRVNTIARYRHRHDSAASRPRLTDLEDDDPMPKGQHARGHGAVPLSVPAGYGPAVLVIDGGYPRADDDQEANQGGTTKQSTRPLLLRHRFGSAALADTADKKIALQQLRRQSRQAMLKAGRKSPPRDRRQRRAATPSPPRTVTERAARIRT
jgi:hypothetical protein